MTVTRLNEWLLTMDISKALEQTVLRSARVVAGHRALGNEIRWVHIIDHPEIPEWVESGQLLLTTGYNWPKEDHAGCALVGELASQGLAGVVLATPRFLDRFPESTVGEANRLGLPLLELDWEIPFSAVMEEIHSQIIRRHCRVIQRSDEIHRALSGVTLKAEALDELARLLASMLLRNVSIVATDGTLLGKSDETRSRAEVENHERAYMWLLEVDATYRRIGSGSAPCVIEAHADTGYSRRLVCPILENGDTAAVIIFDEVLKPFGELDFRAIRHAAAVGALHLAHVHALHVQEERLGCSLVDMLLEGKFDETPSSLERARMSGWDSRKSYRVCTVLLNEPIPLTNEGTLRRARWTSSLRTFLTSTGQPPLIVTSLNQITFLLTTTTTPEHVWSALGSKEIALAVSRPHSGAAGMATGADDVRSLLSKLKPGKIHYFSEVVFPRAMMGDVSARGLFIESKLGALLHGQKFESLLETLDALCVEGFQLTSTAKRLGVHISTLRYRIERIEAVLGPFFEDAGARFELQVAVALHKISTDQ